MPALTTRIGVLAAVLAILAVSASAQAETKYPEKPVRIVLRYGPGGVADVTTRLVAQKLSERMGQNFYIENRPGAGGVLAAKAVLSSPADGYTLYVVGNGTAISESLFKTPPFHILTDFTSVATLAEFEMLLVTKEDSRLDTLAKVVAYAKANPGKLNFGAINVGSTQNLAAELFRMTADAKVTIVTYRTTPDLLTALLRGDVDVGFDYLSAFRPTIAAKQIKVIATGGAHANAELPGVPPAKDSGYPDYVVTSWNALSARAGTPKDIVDKLGNQIQEVLKLPDIRQRMLALGMEPMLGTPQELDERMRQDIERWRVVIDKAGVPKQ